MKQILMKSKLLLLPILLFVAFTIVPKLASAQAGFETGGGTGSEDGVNVVDIPLDGGTVILIAAGVLFGAYRLYKVSQNKLATIN